MTGRPRFVGFLSPHQQISTAETMLQSADIDMTCGKSDRTSVSPKSRGTNAGAAHVISRLENLSVLNIGHVHGRLKQQHMCSYLD